MIGEYTNWLQQNPEVGGHSEQAMQRFMGEKGYGGAGMPGATGYGGRAINMLRNHFQGQQPGIQQPKPLQPMGSRRSAADVATQPPEIARPPGPGVYERHPDIAQSHPPAVQQTTARRRRANLLDRFYEWQRNLQQQGELLRGDESDWQRFMNEKGYGGEHLPAETGFGGRALPMLRQHFHGAHKLQDPHYEDYDKALNDWEHQEETERAQEESKDQKIARIASSVFKRRVAGWEWDDHQNAYIASAPYKFACDCGKEFSTPKYYACKCGKTWNSYVIGTGGDKHQAAAEKYVCRNIDERPDMIVANRHHSNETGPENSQFWADNQQHQRTPQYDINRYRRKVVPGIDTSPSDDGVLKPKKLVGRRRG